MSFWRKALGVLFIVYGVFALVTPFTPGSWLIFVGAEILGIEFLYAHNLKILFDRNRSWLIPLACTAATLLAGAFGVMLWNWYVR